MRAVLVLALLAAACKIDLDHAAPADANLSGRSCAVGTSALCMTADAHADLTWLQTNVFYKSCGAFSQCHDGKSLNVPLDMTTKDKSYASLVNHASDVDASRILVVPGDVAKSYLAVMMHEIEPAAADPAATPPDMQQDKNGHIVGYMPQNGGELCCQKLDAVGRWIEAGAPNN